MLASVITIPSTPMVEAKFINVSRIHVTVNSPAGYRNHHEIGEERDRVGKGIMQKHLEQAV